MAHHIAAVAAEASAQCYVMFGGYLKIDLN